jgi:N-acetylglucosaminyl-diphospho-decaprenol L-rhamnosyltransferase
MRWQVPQSSELNLSKVITAGGLHGGDGNQNLALVTVAYHSQQAIESLAQDLARQQQCQFVWLLVDNAPLSAPLKADQLACRGVEIQIINGQEGEGFGRGCNRAFEVLKAQGFKGWVWLLNPDIQLRRGDECTRMIQKLKSCDQRTVLGTAVSGADGMLEASGGWIDPGLQFRRRRVGNQLIKNKEIEAAVVEVDWLSGCSLALKPEAHRPAARFDLAFPLYYEDIDLCLRLKALGAQVLWWPQLLIDHQKGSGSQVPSSRRLKLSTISYLRFIQRYCPKWVQLLRISRLIINALLRMPLQPKRSAAVLLAFWDWKN